jgi:hypothetical protein
MAVRVTQLPVEVFRAYAASEAPPRVTQLPVEVFRAYAASEAPPRVTQLPIEVFRKDTQLFTASETLAAALTESAAIVERVFSASETLAAALANELASVYGDPADEMRITQKVLEVFLYPDDNELIITQNVLEVFLYPDDPEICLTQQVLEVVRYPDDNEIWMTQLCLEVVFQREGWWVAESLAGALTLRARLLGARNHAFVGSGEMSSTGNPNVSFSL